MSSTGDIDYNYKLSYLANSFGPNLSATCCCNEENWEENYKEWESPFCMATNRFKDDSRAEEDVNVVEEETKKADSTSTRL